MAAAAVHARPRRRRLRRRGRRGRHRVRRRRRGGLEECARVLCGPRGGRRRRVRARPRESGGRDRRRRHAPGPHRPLPCNAVYDVQEGDTVIVHAAAGGMGLLLSQMVKYKGGKVIATVSTDAKAELARQNGADHVLRYEELRREGPRAHRRRRRSGRVRRGRQDHLRRGPRGAAPPQRDGPVRPGQRPRAAGRPAGAAPGRLARPHRPTLATSPRRARSTYGGPARSSR